jgi:hypothetical protein
MPDFPHVPMTRAVNFLTLSEQHCAAKKREGLSTSGREIVKCYRNYIQKGVADEQSAGTGWHT